MPEKVVGEVGLPNSKLGRFLNKYPGVVTSFDSREEEKYLEIRAQTGIDDGEAAAITVALIRKIPLVIEDRKGRSKAENHGIQCINWQQFVGGN